MKLLNQDSEFVNEMNQPKWYKELQKMIYLQSVQQGPMELTVRPNALLQLMESSAVKLVFVPIHCVIMFMDAVWSRVSTKPINLK